MGGCTIFLELRVDGAGLLLRLHPDSDGTTDALVRGAGHALSYLDAAPAPAIRDRISRLAKSFGGKAEGRTGESAAVEALTRAIEDVFPGASLEVKRRVPENQRAPRWPLLLRSGAPDPARGRLWPYDVETTAMRLGLRRLVLREWLAEEDAEADARWLASHGLIVRRADEQPESGPVALFAARDEATIDEARDAHRDACARTASWQDGARRMGAALGYPRCCVEAFVRVRMRDDVVMFADLLPPLPSAPSTPLTGWLVGALTLISHAPCSADCAPTRAIAAATLAELEARHPGFVSLWEPLARRVHAIDFGGRCFAIAAEGSLHVGARVTNGVELVPPERGDATFDGVVRPLVFRANCVVRAVDHQLVASVGDAESWRSALVSDQRAARG